MDDVDASSSLDNDDSSDDGDFVEKTVDDDVTVSCAVRVAIITSVPVDDIIT